MTIDGVGGYDQPNVHPSDPSAFRASCDAARELLGDPHGLRLLVQVVETRLRSDSGIATDVHLDIAEAIVEAHVEELLEAGLSAPRRAQLRAHPRCLVVVAALHYVTTPRRQAARAAVDTPAVLRWATDVARRELPVG